MSAPYSIDLRERVVAAYYRHDMTQEEVAETFSMSVSCLCSYLRLERETGSLLPKHEHRPGPHTVIDEKGLQQILMWVQTQPDITLAELCCTYQNEYGKKVSVSMMCRALQQLNLRCKKKSLYAQEQERADVKKKAKNVFKETV